MSRSKAPGFQVRTVIVAVLGAIFIFAGCGDEDSVDGSASEMLSERSNVFSSEMAQLD